MLRRRRQRWTPQESIAFLHRDRVRFLPLSWACRATEHHRRTFVVAAAAVRSPLATVHRSLYYLCYYYYHRSAMAVAWCDVDDRDVALSDPLRRCRFWNRTIRITAVTASVAAGLYRYTATYNIPTLPQRTSDRHLSTIILLLNVYRVN